MTSDPLSDTLTLVEAVAVTSGGLRAGGVWALRFPATDRLKFLAVVKGECLLQFDGETAPQTLGEGDVVLLNCPPGFVLASDLSTPVENAGDYGPAKRVDNVATIGDGSEFYAVGGHIDLNEAGKGLLLDVLPRSLHVHSDAREAVTIAWLLEQLVQEKSLNRAGGRLTCAQLAQLIFVQILRAHLDRGEALPLGWLRGLADPKIGHALQLIHENPARSWQLAELARAVGMSRTSFAARFRAVVGVAPLGYLRTWRMRLAERALRDGRDSIAEIALSLGYTSESAFSTAFKQVIGLAPRNYRSSHQPVHASRVASHDIETGVPL